MNKSAPIQFPILPVLADRWSPVAFTPKAVEEDKLKRIFEAARWAASSSNEQPWSFVVARSTDAPKFNALADCLMAGNSWARMAPVLVLSVARTVSAGTEKHNRTALHDVGLAVGNLLAQATHEGLVVHQMGGFDVEKARLDLKVPLHHEPVAMMAIGYHGPAEGLAKYLQDREAAPRTRKPIDQFIFDGVWGKELW